MMQMIGCSSRKFRNSTILWTATRRLWSWKILSTLNVTRNSDNKRTNAVRMISLLFHCGAWKFHLSKKFSKGSHPTSLSSTSTTMASWVQGNWPFIIKLLIILLSLTLMFVGIGMKINSYHLIVLSSMKINATGRLSLSLLPATILRRGRKTSSK